jgi:hypothetical protein
VNNGSWLLLVRALLGADCKLVHTGVMYSLPSYEFASLCLCSIIIIIIVVIIVRSFARCRVATLSGFVWSCRLFARSFLLFHSLISCYRAALVHTTHTHTHTHTDSETQPWHSDGPHLNKDFEVGLFSCFLSSAKSRLGR